MKARASPGCAKSYLGSRGRDSGAGRETSSIRWISTTLPISSGKSTRSRARGMSGSQPGEALIVSHSSVLLNRTPTAASAWNSAVAGSGAAAQKTWPAPEEEERYTIRTRCSAEVTVSRGGEPM